MRIVLLLALLCLSACGKTQQVGAVYSAAAPLGTPPPEGKTIFLTIDGTGNSAISRTNAAHLFEMVDATSGARKGKLATYYAEGVGSRNQPLGLALGNGMSDDIRNAYTFLLGTYRKGDDIYLSGFSRGAYGVRALNGLIGFAGIPEAYALKPKDRARLARDLFRAYKIRKPAYDDARNALRLVRIDRVLGQYNLKGYQHSEPFSTPIKAMAIWDTVEALGMPDKRLTPVERIPEYFIEACNVKSVYHALALDDNRAYSFTPLTAGGSLLGKCPGRVERQRIEEVWFAGAHADVGGSYAPADRIDSHLPGVSLNWMLRHLANEGLLAKGTEVFEDKYGPIHDAKAYNAAYKVLYEHYRYPLKYQEEIDTLPKSKPKVHITALQRLLMLEKIDDTLKGQGCPSGTAAPRLFCSKEFGRFGFVAEMIAAGCMYPSVFGYALTPGQQCIRVICDPLPTGEERESTGYCDLEATEPDVRDNRGKRPEIAG